MCSAVLACLCVVACIDADETSGRIDTRLRLHAVEPGSGGPEAVAYFDAVARVHAVADEASDPEQAISALREGLAIPRPHGASHAEAVRLELAARLAEHLLARPNGASLARDVLTPMLATDRSLPVDRASARALVALGDAAAALHDDALATGSYARAIRLMGHLREGLEP